LIRKVRVETIIGVLACVFAFAPEDVAAKAWRGIVPLHSTRADVDKLLGRPTFEDSGYDIDGQRVLIAYSAQGCEEGLPGGWNVPRNTVVDISISSTKDLKLADVLVPGRDYEQIYGAHTPHIDYVDVQDGVRYRTVEGSVQTISYFGAEADNKKLRCGEYKYAAPVPAGTKNKFEQYPFDSYGKIPFEDAAARLDNFVIQLLNLNHGTPHYRGFIIAYAGPSAHDREAQSVAECSKNYLVKVREAAAATIVAVDGGYRDEFIVELYIMPTDAYPPMLLPTVSPRKVEILKGAFAPCSNQPFDLSSDTPETSNYERHGNTSCHD
jgi:hypothetical protein